MRKFERRRLWRLGAVGVLASALVSVGAAPSSAVHDLGLFELDNNAVNGAAPGDDWDNVLLGDGGASVDDTGVLADAQGTTIFTTGGSKDHLDTTQWRHTSGSVPDKDEITNAYAASYIAADGDRIVYFGMDRFAQNGSANIGFWFFQNEMGLNPDGTFSGTPHTVGDVLVLSEFTNGGAVSSINVYEWVGTGGDTNGTLNLLLSTTADCDSPGLTNDVACATVNSSPTSAPWPYTPKQGPSGIFPTGGFFEGGINLTELFEGAVPCFSSFLAETRSSPSVTATLKDFVGGSFGECATSVTTQSSITGSTSIGTGSVSVTDSATVAVQGITTWNGTVQFDLRGPIGSPLEVSTDIGVPVAVSNTTPTVQSATATVTAVGDYCWSAEFTSATTGVPNAVDDGVNECFTVTPAPTALSTQAGAGPVTFGQPISDTATLSGTANQPGTPVINPTTPGAPANGTITFTAYGPNDCTTVAFETTVPVSGDDQYVASFTPSAPGTYHWAAVYSGDSPNTLGTDHNLDCTETSEDVTVTDTTGITSAQTWLPNDAGTVTSAGGAPLNGTLSIQLYTGDNCGATSGSAVSGQLYTSTLTNATSPQTLTTSNTTFTVTASDSVSWLVTFTSTDPNVAGSSHCETTSLTITN